MLDDTKILCVPEAMNLAIQVARVMEMGLIAYDDFQEKKETHLLIKKIL